VLVGDDSRIVPRSSVQARALEDGAVLVDMNSGACFELNLVGFEVWKGLGQGQSASEICATLVGRYRAEPDVIGADVSSLITSLVAAGLVQIVPA
jgi:hypothetical protein